MCVLETESLTRRFGGHTAVDRLTISLEGGEVFGVLGPNGAGKTTTIKMLIRYLMLAGGASVFGIAVDLAVLASAAFLVVVAGRIYPRIAV